MNFSEEKDSLSHCFNGDMIYVKRIFKKIVSYSLNSLSQWRGYADDINNFMKGSFNKTRQNYLHLVKRRTTQFNESNKNTDCVIINSVEVVRAESYWMKTNMWYVNIKHQTSKHQTQKESLCFVLQLNDEQTLWEGKCCDWKYKQRCRVFKIWLLQWPKGILWKRCSHCKFLFV